VSYIADLAGGLTNLDHVKRIHVREASGDEEVTYEEDHEPLEGLHAVCAVQQSFHEELDIPLFMGTEEECRAWLERLGAKQHLVKP
jgi:hypothetical protein